MSKLLTATLLLFVVLLFKMGALQKMTGAEQNLTTRTKKMESSCQQKFKI